MNYRIAIAPVTSHRVTCDCGRTWIQTTEEQARATAEGHADWHARHDDVATVLD